MNFCSQCGQPVTVQVPAGDNRPRHVCGSCGHVHYQNPLIVVGCVPEYRGEILLCRRAIEPRRGFWTVPAGFMEIGETLAEGAIRETWEEAEAQVELGKLFTIVDVVQARQVHVFFRGWLREPAFAAGEESLEVRLFAPAAIPWEEIAFPSVRIALEHCLADTGSGNETLHLASVPPIRLG